jgi:predicted TIM-barrel fold metal-dependent hydrolase
MTPQALPPRRQPSRPRVAVPVGACDVHAHVFAPAGVYPYAARRPYTLAPDTGLAAYRRMLGAIGFQRAVLVHSNIYGPDNRATLDALGETAGAFRGVALVRPEIDDATLERLAAAGMRGVRINLEFPGELALEGVERLAPRLAALGWHLQMLTGAARLPAIAGRLLALPLDVVIDHMGLPASKADLAAPGFASLLELLASGKVWVKLSAPYYGRADAPGYAFATTVARRLLTARPDRMLFGTNWPHPQADPVPDEGALVDWIAAVAASPAVLRQILVDNPARLYGF